MRRSVILLASVMFATNAGAFDPTHNADWALSGILPVTNMDSHMPLGGAPLVLPADAFNIPNIKPAASVSAKTPELLKPSEKRPGVLNFKNHNSTVRTLTAFENRYDVAIYIANTETSANSLEKLIDEKWRATEEFYAADFFKAHQ